MAIVAANWSRRVQITDANLSPSLTGYVALLTEANLPAEIWTTAINGGGDLRVCLNSDGTGQLPLEVVSFDTVAETGVLWVRFPTFASGDSLWLFYGKAGETQAAVTDAFGRNSVWVDYEAVLHGGKTYDSTGNLSQSAVVSGSVVTGFDYFEFNRSAGVVDYGTLIFPEFTYDGVISAVVEMNANPLGNDFIGGHESIFLMADNNDAINFTTNSFVGGINSTQERQSSPSNVALSGRSYMTYRWGNGNANDPATPFEGADFTYNGAISTSDYSNLVGALSTTSSSVVLGGDLSFSTQPIDGKVYELRISTINKTDNDVATEYANQSSPATFWSTGAPESTGGGGGGVAQELVLIAANQANNSSTLSISSSNLLNATTATQNNNTSLMLINAIQQLNSISATQINSSQLLSLEQQQSLQTIIATQINIAGIINLESVQAVSFITATQSNTADALNLDQLYGQVITLIAAEQVNEAQTILISQISDLEFLSANQINGSQALSISQNSKLKTINAQQINTASIMNILASGDNTDLSGLELVQISEVYDLLKIKNEYSLIKK